MEDRGDPRLEAAIGAIDVWRGHDIGVTPMSSNDDDERRFLVEAGDEMFELRITSPASTRSVTSLGEEVELMRAAVAAGVAPEVIAFVPQLGCLVTRPTPGRRLAMGDRAEPGVLASIVGSVRALHACPLPTLERSVFRDAEERRRAALQRGVTMPKTEPDATEAMRRIAAEVGERHHRSVACHGDLTLANLFLEDERVWIVDYRSAGAGDPFDDLACVASALGLSHEESDSLLALYFGAVDDGIRRDLKMARVAADYVTAMEVLAKPTVVTHMQTVEARLASVVDAAADAGVT